MAKSLAGKRAFITGSFQGIGLGIATSLASEGAAIILHGLADAETIAKAESAIIGKLGFLFLILSMASFPFIKGI